MPDGRAATEEARSTAGEARCPSCSHFVLEALSVEGSAVVKVVCRKCRARVIVVLKPSGLTVGQA